VNTLISGCSVPVCGDGVCGAGEACDNCAVDCGQCSGAGGGSLNAVFSISISGNCVGKPISIKVADNQSHPIQNVLVLLSSGSGPIESKYTSGSGKTSFTVRSVGTYYLDFSKTGFNKERRSLSVIDCRKGGLSPVYAPNLKTGEMQSISLLQQEGNAVDGFNVIVERPDFSKEVFSSIAGVVSLPVLKTGWYAATIEYDGYTEKISFEAKAPLQVVPNVKPEARPVVVSVLGEETAQSPNYLLVWVFAAEIISATIIVLTRLKPKWFRVFLALTYTAVPFLANYYLHNFLLALLLTAIETMVLNYLLFRQWKKLRISAKKEAVS
jgi:hypothetical protein